MLTFAIIVFVLAIILTGVLTSFVRVSTINYGVVLFFGKRTEKVLDEGPHWILPFGLQTVEMIPCELREITFKGAESLKTVTADKVVVEIEGELQYRPASLDATYQYQGGNRPLILRFLETTDDRITTGLLGAIKNELGAIAGVTPSDDFIKDRELLSLLIDSLLRLKVPSYLDGKFPGAPVDDPNQRIPFYNTNRSLVRDDLRDAKDDSVSQLELRYGINIVTLTISKVFFSQKVIEAMEREKEELANKKAIGVKVEQVITGLKDLRDKNKGNLTREQANDVMGVLTGTAQPKIIHDVRGLKGGALPVVKVDLT
jgi:regulator of protease activity HflC (stomatin/prohibitin superfamily)